MLHYQNITPILMQINRDKLEEIAKKTNKLIMKDTKDLKI